MRLAELSARSGVPTATIKYYLREGLLPAGRRISATQAAYDDAHLRRLRLVRAMIQVGRVPVATVREVLAAVDDDSLDHHMRLGAAVWALPHELGGTDVTADDDGAEVTEAARGAVDALLDRLDWPFARLAGADSPAYRTLVGALVRLAQLGYPWDIDHLTPYGRLAERLAVADLDMVQGYGPADEQVEAAIAVTVLYEPVLLSLRRLADGEESYRRFGEQEHAPGDDAPEADG
ncbi:MerR family transcriptional regulator [Streptomyces uncialis]|uniref:MerR family transcriptional regulator n=1 Tax=Streptomyces uncialis TaxID=1048205 RepID=UPI003650275D